MTVLITVTSELVVMCVDVDDCVEDCLVDCVEIAVVRLDCVDDLR